MREKGMGEWRDEGQRRCGIRVGPEGGRREGRGWGLDEGPGQEEEQEAAAPGAGAGAGSGAVAAPPGAGRCRYKARAGGGAAPFIAHGMAGGGGAERARPGGLLPPACRQPRRRVSSETGGTAGMGRSGGGRGGMRRDGLWDASRAR